jgi:hypothetical protein
LSPSIPTKKRASYSLQKYVGNKIIGRALADAVRFIAGADIAPFGKIRAKFGLDELQLQWAPAALRWASAAPGGRKFSQLAWFARIPVGGLAFSHNKAVAFVSSASSCSDKRFPALNQGNSLVYLC